MDAAQVWAWLAEVPDPEVPVLSVVDLGIVRDVGWTEDGGRLILEITITPTYTGCPASSVIARDIVAAVRSHGIEDARLRTQLDPPWTTDWLSQSAREKLRASGIAPPSARVDDAVATEARSSPTAWCGPGQQPLRCPRCGSSDTECMSQFGSTPCKALYRCNGCLEPFDHFKCH